MGLLTKTETSLLSRYNDRCKAFSAIGARTAKMRPTAWRDALSEANVCLMLRIEDDVEHFRKWGLLLHVGAVK